MPGTLRFYRLMVVAAAGTGHCLKLSRVGRGRRPTVFDTSTFGGPACLFIHFDCELNVFGDLVVLGSAPHISLSASAAAPVNIHFLVARRVILVGSGSGRKCLRFLKASSSRA